MDENSSVCVCVWKTWWACCLGNKNVSKLDLNECREGRVLSERRGAITSF